MYEFKKCCNLGFLNQNNNLYSYYIETNIYYQCLNTC